jgi:polar amino acid transport system substrate-binding protein
MFRLKNHVPAAAMLLCLLAAVAGAADEGSEPIIVGGDHNYPPYEYLDKDGKPAGYNVELTKAIAEVMGMKVEIRLGPWSVMRKALERGEVDVLQGMAFSEERTREVDFSPPHAIVYQTIWTRIGEKRIRSLEGLRGKEVIVMKNSIMHDFMLQNDLNAAIITTASLADALQLLNSGKHDCALVAKLPGQYLMREKGFANISPVAKPVVAQKYGYAVKKGNTELLSRFSEGLAVLKRTGQFQAIQHQWLGVLDPPHVAWERVIRYGAMVLVPLLLILAGTVVWSRTLQKRVAQRTAELAREVAEKRHALEELRLHQDRLVQADKMASLGILVSGVAHEINNPNGLILLNLPLLAEAFRSTGPLLEEHYRDKGDFSLGWHNYSRMREEVPCMFAETQEAAKRIKRIVEDLKDFARQSDAALTGAIDFNATVQAAVRLVDNAIREATNHLQTDYAPYLPQVRGNAQRIEQVIVNLLLNACQALEDKGKRILLSTFHDLESNEVVLKVRDEGRGIAPEHIPHLTDPFFTTKREGGGTGLGLSVSAGIIKEHGGLLAFGSNPGEGTTVTLTLPVAENAA